MAGRTNAVGGSRGRAGRSLDHDLGRPWSATHSAGASIVARDIISTPTPSVWRSSNCRFPFDQCSEPDVVRARLSCRDPAHPQRAVNRGRPKRRRSSGTGSSVCGWLSLLRPLSACRAVAAPEALEVRTPERSLRSAGRVLAPPGGRDRRGGCRDRVRDRATDRSRVGRPPGG